MITKLKNRVGFMVSPSRVLIGERNEGRLVPRILAGLDRSELARLAKVHITTIVRLEAFDAQQVRGQSGTITAVVNALAKPGIELGENGSIYPLKDGGSWIFRFMLAKQAQKLGLGLVHSVSLQEARIRARQARQLILDGKNPLTVGDDAINATIRDAANTLTFEQAALQFLATDKVANFKNDKHRSQWKSTLEQ